MHKTLIITFAIIFIVEFVAYGMQRAILEMSREAGLPYQVAAIMLPSWYPAVWILRIAKWAVLIFIAFTWSWIVAGGLLFADFVTSSILPIPYQAYVSSYQKRIDQVKHIDHETGQLLESMLNGSKIYGS